MKKVKKNNPIKEVKTNLDIETPKKGKKIIKAKKSYVVVNNLQFNGINYKSGNIINLTDEEFNNFSEKSLNEVILGIKGTL